MSLVRWALAALFLVLLIVGVPLTGAALFGHGGLAELAVGGALVTVAIVGLLATGSPSAHRPRRSPGDLDQSSRAFVAELGSMLDEVRPRRLERARSILEPVRDELLIAHDRNREWDIHVTLWPGEIIVGAANAHEHFYAEYDDDEDGRPWTAQAVDFVAELLRGEIEIRSHYRGRFLTRVAHGRYDEDGRYRSFGHVVPLTPGLLALWAKKRVERERPDFEAAG